jgi:hypothetical protein
MVAAEVRVEVEVEVKGGADLQQQGGMVADRISTRHEYVLAMFDMYMYMYMYTGACMSCATEWMGRKSVRQSFARSAGLVPAVARLDHPIPLHSA